MEAVAAVGVAAAALQFLDFSTKSLALCRQIRDSKTGSTENNAELTKSIEQLTAMQKELRQSGNKPTSIYRKLLQAVRDCSLVASELLGLLQSFQDLAQKHFGALRSASKIWRNGKKIKDLEKRLKDCEARFQIALTMDLREGVIDLLRKQGALQDTMVPKLEQLKIQSTASHSATHSRIRNLEKAVVSSTAAMHKQVAEYHAEQQVSSEGISLGQSILGSNINAKFDEVSGSSVLRDFLEHLYFDDMFARQQSIVPQLPGTYDWILSGDVYDLE